jgi:hypothetical protein
VAESSVNGCQESQTEKALENKMESRPRLGLAAGGFSSSVWPPGFGSAAGDATMIRRFIKTGSSKPCPNPKTS